MTTSNHRMWAIVTGVWIVVVVVGFLSYVAYHRTVAGLATAMVGLAVLLVAMLLAFRWVKFRQRSSGDE